MNFKYIDYFASKHKNEIKKLYMNSFPKNERFPFWLLKHCSKEKNVVFNVILEGNKLIGMEYIIHYENISYLMYLAVDKSQRDKGYGSQILKDLSQEYNTIILSIEKANKDVKDDKQKRKDFYLRNGFNETNKFIQDNEVEYEVLCTNKEYDITEKMLKKRYDKMTNSFMIKYIIGKIFNA